MKANQKFLTDNERGDIGVGTLIIFIAMVLVAAVAATVLIYTTGALQQKATKTSKEATQQISSNIVVEQVLGDRGETSNQSINDLLIRLKPDVGTTSIDLRQVIVTIMDSTKRYDLNYSSEGYNSSNTTNTTNTTYTAIAVRDEDMSFSNTTPVLNSGDLIEIQVSANAIQGIVLAPRKTFWLSLNQELGQAVNLEIATPNSFGVNRYVRLYP
ncbi:MAG: Flagellin B2 precursor [Candidatus Methanoperedens nitroreducens]|uniref:Flagellin n=1 Tax=Candidatus Methanoperedens nitratireducens TaxID=1392998 RepID=A0A0P8AEG0_9EURY|nr:archaellin/type IV pilin N-terminal domain-containing protein [Candidatus Methanoperedens sp. BLZ2]KAB2944826.1 MAG: flagellin [Candidatus Methanoperedens sp.]KPQ42613.1 MAG: Flagellin B2 precursor [Candidatus Methanoperedens sp. BLZ1]MBZ0177116.1 flagellin [Candidatus Methanoperedens nitroreducens]MCX9077547.1 flagellin [Candidatus Methanoperedens sp.]MCX9086390.1 flagellin [Candidatus Methanoperedens sp.]